MWGPLSEGKRRVDLGEALVMSVMFSKMVSLCCMVAKSRALKVGLTQPGFLISEGKL